MKILVAEDDLSSRLMLEGILRKGGYEVTSVVDGLAAWNLYESGNGPELAVFDWMMPGMDGPEICRRVRKLTMQRSPYLVLLTARSGHNDIVEGLEAGADDYIAKPCNPEELLARIAVGVRVLTLQAALATRLQELQEAFDHIEALQEILPICSYCHSIRDDKQYWHKVEVYFEEHTRTRFSHGICPSCLKKEMHKRNKIQ